MGRFIFHTYDKGEKSAIKSKIAREKVYGVSSEKENILKMGKRKLFSILTMYTCMYVYIEHTLLDFQERF